MQPKTKQGDETDPKRDQNEPSQLTGSERARDEQREEGGPRYGGEAWQVADARGDNRFGKARNDDADPLELVKPGQEDEDLEAEVSTGDATGEQMTTHTESGGEAAGMGRGEKPRKPKSRAKK
jgi:hypothetical protein